MVDTAKSLSALQTLLADNASGDISAQDVRDFLVSVYAAESLFRDIVIQNGATPASEVDILSGIVGDTEGIGVIEITTSGGLTADITASGVNGLDTGSEASSTWYYIWLIKDLDGGTVASLLSTSAVSPTMPSGYTAKRLVGAVYNDASSNFLDFVQFGKRVFYVDEIVVYNATPSSANWINVDCSASVPPISRQVDLYTRFEENATGTSGVQLFMKPDGTLSGAGSGGTRFSAMFNGLNGDINGSRCILPLDVNEDFSFYQNNGDTNSITHTICGFVLDG